MSLEVWYDCETTGLKIEEGAAVCQLAVQLVNGNTGEVLDTINHNVDISSYERPTTISEDALKANGRTSESLFEGSSLKEVMDELMTKVQKHTPRGTKAVLVGYNNSSFDKYFIEEMVALTGYKFWIYFNWKQIDVFELVKVLQHMGYMGKTFNQKLGTVMEYLEIEPDGNLHDALVDVQGTREIYYKIKKSLMEN